MMNRTGRFNLYLAALMALSLAAGCNSTKKEMEKNEVSSVQLHVEVNRDGASDSTPVAINRARPVYVNIKKAPFLDSTDLKEASVLDEPGGLFSIRLKFNDRGSLMLEGMTTMYRGSRMAIYCHWDEARWLAAPVLQKSITDGVVLFTPDATREEAERIVRGLNNVAKREEKSWMKW